jgi:hypothetical protein
MLGRQTPEECSRAMKSEARQEMEHGILVVGRYRSGGRWMESFVGGV